MLCNPHTCLKLQQFYKALLTVFGSSRISSINTTKLEKFLPIILAEEMEKRAEFIAEAARGSHGMASYVKEDDLLWLCETSSRIFLEEKSLLQLDGSLHIFGKIEFGIHVYQAFINCFNCLPFAALVNDRIFCVHGGISPELHDLDQIYQIRRPTGIPDVGLLCDLVWSDPDPAIVGWDVNAERGLSFKFGGDVLQDFLLQHDLDLVVRSHQPAIPSGYHMQLNYALPQDAQSAADGWEMGVVTVTSHTITYPATEVADTRTLEEEVPFMGVPPPPGSSNVPTFSTHDRMPTVEEWAAMRIDPALGKIKADEEERKQQRKMEKRLMKTQIRRAKKLSQRGNQKVGTANVLVNSSAAMLFVDENLVCSWIVMENDEPVTGVRIPNPSFPIGKAKVTTKFV